MRSEASPRWRAVVVAGVSWKVERGKGKGERGKGAGGQENPRWRAVVGADASVCPGAGHQAGALGTEPLSAAKRSRREDKGSVPMAGGPGERGPGTGREPWGLNHCPQRSGAEGKTSIPVVNEMIFEK